MTRKSLVLAGLMIAGVVGALTSPAAATDKWVVATGRIAETSTNAKDRAVKLAMRSAVEKTCGVFLSSQSKARNYKMISEKVFTNTSGYILEHKVLRVWTTDDGITSARVRVRISTKGFEKSWAMVTQAIEQENNPRVIIAMVESSQDQNYAKYEAKENGIVQTRMEGFFVDKGVEVRDKSTSKEITKRDVLLAAIEDDATKLAALGAKFNADVVVAGRATAKYSKTLKVAGQNLNQYTASLNVRVIQCDSARVLVSKTYGPYTVSSLQKAGSQKALSKLADEAAPSLLKAVAAAWQKRAINSRTVRLSVNNMDYGKWRQLRDDLKKLSGIQSVRLREITKNVATIDVEGSYSNEELADELMDLGSLKLEVTEISANRIKLEAKGDATEE